jgi:ABC-type multidrug transport system fused ATPase/permease subunit
VSRLPDRSTISRRVPLARFLYENLAGYRALLGVGIAMTIVQVFAELLIAFPLKFILDKVVNHRNPSFPFADALIRPFDHLGSTASLAPGEAHTQLGVIAFSATLLIACGLLAAALTHGQLILAARVGTSSAARLRCRLFDHLQRLPLAWHGRQRTGDLVQRLTTNIADIQKLVTDGLVDLLAGTLTLVGVMVVMLLVNWQFTLLSMVIVPALFATVLVYTRRIKAATKRAAKIQGQIGDIATEDMRAIIDVKSFTLEARESEHFGRYTERLRNTAWRAGRLQSQFTPLVMALIAVSQVTIIGGGAYVATGHSLTIGSLVLVHAHTLTLGTLTVYLTYLKLLYQPMRDLSKLATLASTASSGAERIQAVLDQAPELLAGSHASPGAHVRRLRFGQLETLAAHRSDADEPREQRRVTGEIRFRDVLFGYEPERPVLVGIDLEVPAGGRLALVGLSGSGKTTTVKLIPRLYEVWSGSVEIDGLDTRAYPLDALRRNVSMVLQDAVLFEGTIRDNIALGRPEASDDEIVEAARRAHIDSTIASMPDSYASEVREHGKNLSSGQRQRIAIARAILRDAPILILDEPTANLDVEAEVEVMHAIDTLISGRTVITISHRLSTLGHVDEIAVLSEGRIAERGTYRQLKRRGGIFKWMLDEQHRYSPEHISAAPRTSPARGTRREAHAGPRASDPEASIR